VVAVDPNNPKHLIAGQNDSRIGFNHCGYDWSFDGGKTWGDQVPPFYQFVLADGHTADACSDPTATFDSKGNVYVGGVLFDINSAASAFVVAKSNAHIGGTFYHTPNSALSFQEYRDTPLGVVASDNNPNVFHDKGVHRRGRHGVEPEGGQRLRDVDAVRLQRRSGGRAQPDLLQPVDRRRSYDGRPQ